LGGFTLVPGQPSSSVRALVSSYRSFQRQLSVFDSWSVPIVCSSHAGRYRPRVSCSSSLLVSGQFTSSSFVHQVLGQSSPRQRLSLRQPQRSTIVRQLKRPLAMSAPSPLPGFLSSSALRFASSLLSVSGQLVIMLVNIPSLPVSPCQLSVSFELSAIIVHRQLSVRPCELPVSPASCQPSFRQPKFSSYHHLRCQASLVS
jgi:hypothetical protein